VRHDARGVRRRSLARRLLRRALQPLGDGSRDALGLGGGAVADVGDDEGNLIGGRGLQIEQRAVRIRQFLLEPRVLAFQW